MSTPRYVTPHKLLDVCRYSVVFVGQQCSSPQYQGVSRNHELMVVMGRTKALKHAANLQKVLQ
jgi:hypothetical protein